MAMTPEERERFKEAEKEHLRALKKLKEAARQTRRRASVNQALANMAGALGQEDSLDVHDEMLDKLALDTARKEARMEIALENAALKEAVAREAEPSTRSLEKLEEETMKARAKTLIEQMKLQMGMATPYAEEQTPATPSKTIGKKALPEAKTKPSPPSDRPEKTIGRMK